MPSYFVNLPVSYVIDKPEYFDFFLEQRIAPELGLDAVALQECAPDKHREIADAFAEAKLPCSVHLAFLDLAPGTHDDLILEATRARLDSCIDAARIHNPKLMIGHPHYDENAHTWRFARWITRCRDTFARMLDRWPEHPPLYLENTFDTDPEPLAELVQALRDAGYARTGVCLDVGHWYSFAHGAKRRDLDRWLDCLAPYIGHLHLHDNDGSDDQHLGLGQGTIPWAEVVAKLAARNLSPTASLEPHTKEAYADTLAFMRKTPELFTTIRDAYAAG